MSILYRGKYYFALFTILLALLAMQGLYKNSLPIKNEAQQNAEQFVAELDKLVALSNTFKFKGEGLNDLRQQLATTRLAYKKLEFLLEYYYPDYIEEYINGAPLMHIQRNNAAPSVLPPEGLQVLDELIFAENAEEEKLLIASLAQQLKNNVTVLLDGFATQPLADADVLSAMQEELIRVFAMGLTGFDTPGSANALPEAAAALGALQDAAQLLFTDFDADASKHLNQNFVEAIVYVNRNSDFETFDRLFFLKEYINPIYATIGRQRQKMVSPAKLLATGRNANSESIFSADFLDPYFYTELKQKEDSPELNQLGMRLFYEPMLSADGKMSCGTCHNPAMAFADGQAKSASNVAGKTVQRNAPTLLNAVYADRYFYDVRAFTLEQQAEHVIFNQHEFNTGYTEILEKLNADKSYREQFKSAFGTTKITREAFSSALASFVISLQSFNSNFDKYARGETDTLNDAAQRGFNLFMGKAACGTCHFAPTFSGLVPPRFAKNETEILGVLANPTGWDKKLDDDFGRFNNLIYSEQAYIYERSFKTTTVRNVKLTAPYFYNGAYNTLEDVLVFYNRGGGSGYGLEVPNQTLPGEALNLSPEEIADLIAFMHSLTDNGAAREN
jgi:cytochrome c peroxidase